MKTLRSNFRSRLNNRLIEAARKSASGQVLHEVMVASSLLAITVVSISSSIIKSNAVTASAGDIQQSASLIKHDLETIVKPRFYSYRCSQGPCFCKTVELEERLRNQSKALNYYTQENKSEFQSLCSSRSLAKDLLEEEVDGVRVGESTLNASGNNGHLSIRRSIRLVSDNANSAEVTYTAYIEENLVATSHSVLVPNAVHWCS